MRVVRNGQFHWLHRRATAQCFWRAIRQRAIVKARAMAIRCPTRQTRQWHGQKRSGHLRAPGKGSSIAIFPYGRFSWCQPEHELCQAAPSRAERCWRAPAEEWQCRRLGLKWKIGRDDSGANAYGGEALGRGAPRMPQRLGERRHGAPRPVREGPVW
jgi:hypothetical protein